MNQVSSDLDSSDLVLNAKVEVNVFARSLQKKRKKKRKKKKKTLLSKAMQNDEVVSRTESAPVTTESTERMFKMFQKSQSEKEDSGGQSSYRRSSTGEIIDIGITSVGSSSTSPSVLSRLLVAASVTLSILSAYTGAKK